MIDLYALEEGFRDGLKNQVGEDVFVELGMYLFANPFTIRFFAMANHHIKAERLIEVDVANSFMGTDRAYGELEGGVVGRVIRDHLYLEGRD